MTKISIALATVLVLASAASNVAFAAMPDTRTAVSEGQAYNECRAQQESAMNDHHAHPIIEACVQRLMHVNQSTTY